MKKIITCLLCLFILVQSISAQEQVFLQINNPEYIDLQNSNERIDKVVTNKHKTVVYLSCSGASESNIIVPKNTYIVDENGRKYNIIKANGIILDKKRTIGKSGKLSYMLTFPSLPEGTKCFDLVQSHKLAKIYYFNIHEAGSTSGIATSVDTTGINEAINKALTDNMFRKDTVYLCGQFKGTKDFEKRKYAITFVAPVPSVYNDSYSEKFEINTDGTFNVAIPVFGPTWTELIVLVPDTPIISKTIPVMLYPGDHLSLVIDDYDSEYAKLNWKSEFTYNNQFVEMCEAFPTLLPSYKEGQQLSLDSMKQAIVANEQAACYLSNKYKLSKAESALLLTQANMSKVCEALTIIDQYVLFNRNKYHKSLNGAYPTSAQFDTLQNYCKSQLYTIISQLRAENKAFLIVPSLQVLTRNLNKSPLFHAITYQKDYFSIPEDYRYLYWNDSAIHLLRMFRNKPIGTDRLFEQWFNIASLEVPNKSKAISPNLYEVIKIKTEAITLPVFNAWKYELLTK